MKVFKFSQRFHIRHSAHVMALDGQTVFKNFLGTIEYSIIARKIPRGLYAKTQYMLHCTDIVHYPGFLIPFADGDWPQSFEIESLELLYRRKCGGCDWIGVARIPSIG